MLAGGSVLPFLVLVVLSLTDFHESPRWLFMNGRKEEAEMVLTAFVGKEEAQQAMQAMQAMAKEGGCEEFVTWPQVVSGLRNKETRSMFQSGLTVACGQMLCGVLPMMYFSSAVLKTRMSEQ